MVTSNNAKFSLQEICSFLEISVPEHLEHLRDFRFSSIEGSTLFLEQGSAFFVRSSESNLEWLIKTAISKGVTVFFADTPLYNSEGTELPCVIIDDPDESFIKIATWIKTHFALKTIAITGSIGKTTTKDMLEKVVSQQHITHSNIGNRNTPASIAKTIQGLVPEHEVYVQEVAAGEHGLVEKSARMLRPDAFIFTNIGMSHVARYGDDPRAILQDKLQLDVHLKEDGVAFINYDDPVLREVSYRNKVVTFSANSPEADYYARDVKFAENKIAFILVEKSTGLEVPASLRTTGIHNVINAVVCFAVGRWLGMETSNITEGLLAYRSSGIRQNYTKFGNQRVFIDCFNSSEKALETTLETMKVIPLPEKGKRILIAGDILELGDFSESTHRRVGQRFASDAGIDAYLLFGPSMHFAFEEMKDARSIVRHTENREELNSWIKEFMGWRNILAFKASGGINLSVSIDNIFGTDFSATNLSYRTKHGREKNDGVFTYFLLDEIGSVVWRVSKEETGSLIVPGAFNDMPIHSVSRRSFAETGYRAVTLNAPLRSIGEQAFYKSAIEDIVLPGSLQIIGDKAFAHCHCLKEIVIPEGVTTIGEAAFSYCEKLGKLVMPKTVKAIRKNSLLKSPHVEVVCVKGSFAEKAYAKRWPDHTLTLLSEDEYRDTYASTYA